MYLFSFPIPGIKIYVNIFRYGLFPASPNNTAVQKIFSFLYYHDTLYKTTIIIAPSRTFRKLVTVHSKLQTVT